MTRGALIEIAAGDWVNGSVRVTSRSALEKWAVAHGAGPWLTLQVIETIGPRWGLTDPVSRMLDVLLVAGFAATLVPAWHHGEQGRQRVSGIELLFLGALQGRALDAASIHAFRGDQEAYGALIGAGPARLESPMTRSGHGLTPWNGG